MSDELSQLKQEVERLRQALADLENRVRPLFHIQIAPESGGGNVVYSANDVKVKLDAITRLARGDFSPVPPPTSPEPQNIAGVVAMLSQVIFGTTNPQSATAGGGDLTQRLAAVEAAINGASVTTTCNPGGGITTTITWGTSATLGGGSGGGGSTGGGGGSGGMNNPMTAEGDMIVGGTDGDPASLTVGSEGQIMKVVSGSPAWAAETTSAFSGAKVSRSSNLSVSNNTDTYPDWQTENWDTDAYWDAGSPKRFTIATTGKYRINVSGFFAGNATGVRYVAIRLNGTTAIMSEYRLPPATSEARVSVILERAFTAADYVEVNFYQNSGGSLNLLSDPSTFMEIERLE